jgi:hypothetical protein
MDNISPLKPLMLIQVPTTLIFLLPSPTLTLNSDPDSKIPIRADTDFLFFSQFEKKLKIQFPKNIMN